MSNALCTSTWAKENGVLFYNDEVYIREDAQAYALLEMRRVLGRSYAPTILTAEAFDELLTNIWQQNSGVSQQLVDDMDADIDLMALTEEIPDNEDLLDNDENSPVIRLINAILGEAVKDGASDIHIETFERTLSIRFRVDGVLRPVLQPARKLAPLLVSRQLIRLDVPIMIGASLVTYALAYDGSLDGVPQQQLEHLAAHFRQIVLGVKRHRRFTPLWLERGNVLEVRVGLQIGTQLLQIQRQCHWIVGLQQPHDEMAHRSTRLAHQHLPLCIEEHAIPRFIDEVVGNA